MKTSVGADRRIVFVGRLLEPDPGWQTPDDLIAALAEALPTDAAGLRWPADGAALVYSERRAATANRVEVPIPVANQSAGVLWAAVDEKGAAWLGLIARVLGCSPILKRWLGAGLDQARIAERLADAGKIAGRVAHDLDNVFQGVVGFTSLALETMPSGLPAVEYVREVERSARHGMELCSRLHQLSRSGTARPLPSSVNTALDKELARVRSSFTMVRFVADVPPNLPPVAMENGGVQTALGAVLDNAAEAAPPRSEVTVSGGLFELTPREVPTYLGCPGVGPHVQISIQDRGPGVTPEVRQKMGVEPFFTTKFRHRGLSLAVVFRILHAHRGGLRVESEPGQGTTVRVAFPLAAARPSNLEAVRGKGGSFR